MSAPILRGQLNGSDRDKALNVTVTSYSPVLELSRLLIGVGIDPATPLSIGEATRLHVATNRVGSECVAECTAGPPVLQKANEVSPNPGVRSGS
jgi:hypothetical protein